MHAPTCNSRLAFGRFPFVAAIYLLTLVTAVSLGAQSSATFTSPVNVSQDNTAYQPQMVVDSAGNVFIAYLDTGASVNAGTVWVAHGTSSGGSFHATSVPVGVTASCCTYLSIAVESPCAIDVAYTGSGDGDLFVAQSTDCGATFAPAVNVTNYTAGYFSPAFPQLIISQGTVGVVWRANVSSTSFSQSIFYAQRNSASTFTTPSALVTSSSGVGSLTALLIPTSGNTAVGWCGDANGSSPGSVWFLPSVSGAQPIQVGTAPFAKFAVDPTGNVYVALSNSSGTSQFSRSIGPSGPFSPPVLFPGPGTVVMQMRADANGNLNLLFVQEGGGLLPGGNQTYEMETLSFSRSVDQGSTFSNPASIASYTSSLPGGPAFREPEMAIHSDGAADVAWAVEGGWSSSQYPQGLSPVINTLLCSSRSNDDGTSFSTPPVATPFTMLNSECSTCLQIGTDNADHVLLAWGDNGLFVTEESAPSDFTITAAPAAQSVLPGGSANFPLTLYAGGGFSDTVNLTCTNLPPGATCAFNPASLTPTSSSANVTLTIATPATLAQGNDSVTVSASSPGIQHTQSVQLAVGGITGSLTPSSATIAAGSSGNFAVSMNATGGFAGQLALSCSGVPSGMACTFNPPQVSVAANGIASSTLTVNVASQPTVTMAPGRRQNWPLPLSREALLIAASLLAAFAVKRHRFASAAGLASLAAVLVLAVGLISCGGATTTSNPGTGATATATTGTTGTGGPGTTGGTGTSGTSGAGGSGSSGSGSGGSGTGSGSGGSGGSGSGAGTGSSGGSSVTSQIIVQAQSGGATVNLGTASITVP